MSSGKNTRWTQEMLDDLLRRASVPGATAQALGAHYGISASGIRYVLTRAGKNEEFTRMRREWNVQQAREHYRKAIREAMKKAGGVQEKAARLVHLSYWRFNERINRLFTEKEKIEMRGKRACIICGKTIQSAHWRIKICSEECRVVRERDLAAQWRRKNGKGWELWVKRDRDMLEGAIVRHYGKSSAIAKELGVSRRAVQHSIRRWGLADLARQMREQWKHDRIEKAVEVIRAGATIADAAREIGICQDHLSDVLHQQQEFADVLLLHTCRNCGKRFTRSAHQARHCSPECKLASGRARRARAHQRESAMRKRERAKAAADKQKQIINSEIIIKSKYL